MRDRDVSVVCLAMYRRMAKEALDASQRTVDRAQRADYLEFAAHWKSVAIDIEKLLAVSELPRPRVNAPGL